jgi:hypothetical protein
MGYAKDEIEKVAKEMAKIQRQRKLSMAFTPCGELEHAVQSLGRKFRRYVLGRGGDKMMKT